LEQQDQLLAATVRFLTTISAMIFQGRIWNRCLVDAWKVLFGMMIRHRYPLKQV
jgi:hypothetical protein